VDIMGPAKCRGQSVKSGEEGEVPLKVPIASSPLEKGSQVHVEEGKQQAVIVAVSIGAKEWDDVWVLGVVKQPQTAFFAHEQSLAPVFRSASISAEGLAHNYNRCILQSLVRSGFKGTRWGL
jgi:hypothetical protein